MKLLIAVAVFILAGLVTSPAQCLAGAGKGLALCFEVIVPSLFPFFVCSKLLIHTGAVKKLGGWCHGIMRPLFNLPGSAGVALVLGFLSGYPVGAQCGADLYEKNLCTRAEAQRMVCLCNNSGPLFIIGSVGAGMLYSRNAGILLYIIHVLSALTLGFILSFYKRKERMTVSCARYRSEAPEYLNIGAAISVAVSQAVELILYVCGFIVFFSTLLVILDRFGVISVMQGILGMLGISANVSRAVSFGFFEVTGGMVRAAALPIGRFRLVIASMLLAWSGVSVVLQVAGILSKSGLSVRTFILAKGLQAVIAGVYAMIFVRIPGGSIEAFAGKSASVLDAWAYSLALMCIGAGVIIFLSLLGIMCQKLKR